jgi:hypothetical protein
MSQEWKTKRNKNTARPLKELLVLLKRNENRNNFPVEHENEWVEIMKMYEGAQRQNVTFLEEVWTRKVLKRRRYWSSFVFIQRQKGKKMTYVY